MSDQGSKTRLIFVEIAWMGFFLFDPNAYEAGLKYKRTFQGGELIDKYRGEIHACIVLLQCKEFCFLE